jgi:hypothetical protein
MDQVNDGKFPDDNAVEVRYPLNQDQEQGDRSRWPWLPGSIVSQGAPDEWCVCVEVRALATLEDGRLAPAGTAEADLYYPCCFRDATEIRACATGGPGVAR